MRGGDKIILELESFPDTKIMSWIMSTQEQIKWRFNKYFVILSKTVSLIIASQMI